MSLRPQQRASPRDPPLSLRLAWGFSLLAHVALASVALWFLPHGFPFFHRRFVLSTLAPACIAAGSLALAVALVFAPRAGVRFVPVVAAFWGAGALGLLLVFPVTGAAAARPIGLVALFFAVLAAVTCRKRALFAWLPAALLAAAAGFGLACAERPMPPATQPAQQDSPRRARVPREPIADRFELGPNLSVESSSLTVTWRGREASISIAPALDFDRTPADGFWSIFSNAVGRAPEIASATKTADSLGLWAPDGQQRLFVQKKASGLELEAWTLLERPTYSHLNSFATVRVSGHQKLALRFSPCPSALIPVTHADYPRGAPARFAYVDAERRFHVVQASDAEKGPFTSLAKGLFTPSDSLFIDLVELSDNERVFAQLEFLDFAAQLSTALSPTAGYGVSENAIQFGLADANPSSPAQLLLTLGASGVGRGWDSVGHRAGAYRNRVLLHPFERPPPPEPETPSDVARASACSAIARDIASLMPSFPQLAAFDPSNMNVNTFSRECSITYKYRTHQSTVRGGWAAQVPAPDPDGVWFHIGIWAPDGLASRAQINTQPGAAVFEFGDQNITVLILDGEKNQRLGAALRQLLKRRGMGQLKH